MSRLDRQLNNLNNPRIVLAVGTLAVALNGLLYFGVYLPKMAPVFGTVVAFGASLPESMPA